MKKRIITGLLAAVMAITLTVPTGGIKAEAKYVDWSEYDKSTCICTGNYRNINCTSKRHQIASIELVDSILTAAKPIIDSAPDAPHEAVKHFHDEICKKTAYTTDVDINTAGAYGSLVKGRTKCTGYSEAFKVLCDISGIPCYKVGGAITSGMHAWNVVQLEDGEWYEVDCTFDDTASSSISYDWFLVTTAQMNKDHKRSSDSTNLPIANGTLYAYNKKAVKVGDAKYKVIDSGKAEYTEATKSAKGTVNIPDTVTIGNTTYEVTSIAKNAFKGNKKIKKVTIGKNIETIGSGAFSNCPNLKNVDMSKCRVNTLSKNLFKGSKKLSKLSINGENVTSAGKNALKNIAPKCKITILNSDKNSGLVRSLKKQGAKKAKFIFK